MQFLNAIDKTLFFLVLLLIEWVDFRGFLNSPLERGQGCVLLYNNRYTPRHFVTPLSRGDSLHGKQSLVNLRRCQFPTTVTNTHYIW